MKLETTKILQFVLIFLAVVLVFGAGAALLGVFEEIDTDKPDENTGTGTVAPNETYTPSGGDASCIHTMDDGKVVKQATCAVEGTKVFTCKKCGYTREEKTSKTNQHTYALKKYSDNAHMKYCTVCNNSTDYEDHALSENILEATCDTSGKYTYSCACGYEKVETVPAKGHSVTQWHDSGEYHTGVCTRSGCGQYVTSDHVYGSVVTINATCITSGSKKQTCGDCGAIKTTLIPILGHDWKEDPSSLGNGCEIVKNYICANCYESKSVGTGTYEHKYSSGSCTVCGTVDPDYNNGENGDSGGSGDSGSSDPCASGHSYNIIDSFDATCTTPGYTTSECSECGSRVTETIFELGHAYETIGTDVHEDGSKAFIKECRRCGDVIIT